MTIYTCPRCGSDLVAICYTTYPPTSAYICEKCGWEKMKQETIERVPFKGGEHDIQHRDIS